MTLVGIILSDVSQTGKKEIPGGLTYMWDEYRESKPRIKQRQTVRLTFENIPKI